MKIRRECLLLSCLVLAACATQPVRKAPEMTVADLVGIINDTWLEKKAEIAKDGLTLDTAKLTVETIVTTTTANEFDLVVFTADASRQIQNTQSVEFDLKPPAQKNGSRKFGAQDVKDELGKAIRAAANTASSLLNSQRPLVLDSVSVTVGFDVTVSADGGVQIKLGPITLGPKITRSAESSQQIEFDFKRSS